MSSIFTHDKAREARIGIPEAVLSEWKTSEHLAHILEDAITGKKPLLFTRLSQKQFDELPAPLAAELDYDPISRTGFHLDARKSKSTKISVVAAGTSDIPVAKEVVRALDFMGFTPSEIYDVGVAGLWRLQERLPEINSADIVIAVAGMDAALVSVLGGVVAAPLIAVPTSVGYGTTEDGKSALASCLSSCAPGVTVLNIDNGYGAACAAIRIANLLSKEVDGHRQGDS